MSTRKTKIAVIEMESNAWLWTASINQLATQLDENVCNMNKYPNYRQVRERTNTWIRNRIDTLTAVGAHPKCRHSFGEVNLFQPE